MAEVPVPTYRDLLLPTLQAVQQLGGSATIRELDEMVLSIADVTNEQLAVEFPPGSSSSGSEVVNRMHWARSYLKSVGALKDSKRGICSITAVGTEYLKLQPAEAEHRLREVDTAVRAESRKASPQRESQDEVEDEPNWRRQLLATLEVVDRGAFDRWRY